MKITSKLRKQLRVAKEVHAAGRPENGWGPSLEALHSGRKEFAGLAESGAWAQSTAIIYVYSDDSTDAPTALELRFVDPNGEEVLEERDEVSSGDAWSVDEIEHLAASLVPQGISWFDPVASFKLAYE